MLKRSCWFSWGRQEAVPPLPHVQVIVYTRQGCHLCDDALVEVRREQERRGFALQVVDVDGDPELVARYGECVPVVLVDGKLRFRGRVNRVLLERLLRAESNRRRT